LEKKGTPSLRPGELFETRGGREDEFPATLMRKGGEGVKNKENRRKHGEKVRTNRTTKQDRITKGRGGNRACRNKIQRKGYVC